MKQFLSIILFTITLFNSIYAQVVTISGYVSEENTGNPLSEVSIIIQGVGLFTETDTNGEFHFSGLKETSYHLKLDKLGYRSQLVEINPAVGEVKLRLQMTPTLLSFGEVTVTGTKFDQLLKETPLSMELTDKSTIGKTAVVAVPDIIRNQPGVALVRDGIWGTDINIRGLSRQNVVTLIDGNRIETASNHAASLSLVDILDVENVEVIKGGISSLYGTGATGGVVSITTKRPHYTENVSLTGSLISSYNSVNSGSAGYLSLSGSSSWWYAKASGTLRSAIDAKTKAGIIPNSYFRDRNYSGIAGLKFSDTHQLLLSYQKFYGNDIGIPGGKSFPASAVARYTEASREMYSGEYKIRNLMPVLSNLSLNYFNQKITRLVELKPSATQTLKPGADHLMVGVQMQSDWVWSDSYHLVAGLDFWQRRYDGFRETIVKTGSTTKITGDYPVPDSKYRSFGLFAQEEFFLLNKQLKLNVGGRYDLIRVTNNETKNPAYIITNGNRNNNLPQNAQASFNAGDFNDRSWSANIGALYSFPNDIDVTLNIAHAFRSPVLEERFQYINLGGDIYLGNPALSPETGNFIDVGMRIWKNDITLKANVFLNYFSNLVVDKQIIKDSLYQKANVGKARINGVEIALEYNLFSNVSLFTSGTYLKGTDTEKDISLPQIPAINGKTGLKYALRRYGELELSAFYFADQENLATGESRTPGYTIYNVYLSSIELPLSMIHSRIAAGVENVFDRLYKDHLSTNRGLIKYEPGRNFFLKLEVRW